MMCGRAKRNSSNGGRSDFNGSGRRPDGMSGCNCERSRMIFDTEYMGANSSRPDKATSSSTRRTDKMGSCSYERSRMIMMMISSDKSTEMIGPDNKGASHQRFD